MLRSNIASLPLEICTSTIGAVGHRSSSVNLAKDHEVLNQIYFSSARCTTSLMFFVYFIFLFENDCFCASWGKERKPWLAFCCSTDVIAFMLDKNL